MWRSGNPTLKGSIFGQSQASGAGIPMTIDGTVNKSFLLLTLVLGGACLAWSDPARFFPFTLPLVVAAFIVSLVTVFKKQWSMVTAPLYATLEGIVLGVLSVIFERRYPGIVIHAVALTFGVMSCLLLAYKSRLVRASENFKLGVVAATGGIAIVYIIDLALGFFGRSIPLIHQSGAFGIGFSIFVVAVASFNLVLDFDFIENGARIGAPKYMEWYGAFGLMVTLVWLYLEILRLLAKTRRR
jgi:uncharacterized YccA/Bax inhibitor family protein